jgi:murein DD-endopeptidase MepM/ murein hydrolase activator NlpD
MADQRYTIIIVPRASSPLRKIQISQQTLKFTAIGIAVVFLAILGTMVHYVKLFRETRTVANLQKQNFELRSSLEQSQLLTQRLNRKISFLTDLSGKLKVMAGLPADERGKKKLTQKMGMGGVTMGTDSMGIPDPQRLVNLERRADYLEKSFNVLNHFFEDRNAQLSSTPSIIPTQGFLSSLFGSRRNPFTNAPDFHEGIDITNEIGTPVVAPASGTIVFAGSRGNYGNVVEIKHDGEMTTLFGHMNQIHVKKGQQVKRWEVIGTVGNTGKSTGPHLHYEVHISDQPVNPLPYLLNLDSLG